MKIQYLLFIRLTLLMITLLIPKSQAYAYEGGGHNSIPEETMCCAALVDHYEQEQFVSDQLGEGLN